MDEALLMTAGTGQVPSKFFLGQLECVHSVVGQFGQKQRLGDSGQPGRSLRRQASQFVELDDNEERLVILKQIDGRRRGWN